MGISCFSDWLREKSALVEDHGQVVGAYLAVSELPLLAPTPPLSSMFMAVMNVRVMRVFVA